MFDANFSRVIVTASILLLAGSPAFASEKLALVIGNSKYESRPLLNPARDAKGIAQALRSVGFEVVEKHNLDRKSLRRSIRTFTDRLDGDDVGFFYYAGHGAQVSGVNYLIPLRADISSDIDVEDEAVMASYVLRQMENRGNAANIVVLDACRDNPYPSSSRSGTRGLARVSGPVGSLVAFSTAPGTVASDGSGQRNSPYAAALIQNIQTPGLSIEQLFKEVRKSVKQKTGGQQIPVEESKLVDDIYLAGKSQGGVIPVVPAADREAEFWRSVNDAKSPEMYQAYLEAFPNGLYALLARMHLKQDRNSTQISPQEELLLKKAGGQNRAEAMTNLGHMYYLGKGVAQDYSAAVRWYRKAVEKGSARAMTNLGFMYDKGKGVTQDYAEAVRWYRKAAEKDGVVGMRNLGSMYKYGKGVAQDYSEAERWYRKAAEKGDIGGMVNLGNMYLEGNGVAQDYSEAVRWYREAVEKDSAEGMTNLGYMYEAGKGVAQDYSEAVRWYRQAAEKNSVSAMKNLGDMYRERTGVAQNYSEAVRWYSQAAEKGDVFAMTSLGIMYDEGEGVAQDYSKAMRWYRRAAEKDFAWAMRNLGNIYSFGKGVSRNYVKAAHWLEKAAKAGDSRAMHNLGVLYSFGWGVAKDKQQAAFWIQKALDNGAERKPWMAELLR